MDEALASGMHSCQLPPGAWNYVVDDGWIVYHRPLIPPRLRAGVWPFAREGAEYTPGSVRLAPDCEYQAWGNEYVLVWPDTGEPHPHLAEADLRLRAGSQDTAGSTVSVTAHLDLRARAFQISRMPEDAPAALRAQADAKGRKLISYLAGECVRRDSGGSTAPVTARDLEERRAGARAEKILAYCAEHGLRCERLPRFGSNEFLIDGERLDVHEVSARYLPGLFSDPQERARLPRPSQPAAPVPSRHREGTRRGKPDPGGRGRRH